jgi:hypothetical protein
MENTLISEKQYLFALCITDGALDDMSEEQKSSVILAVNNMLKKTMLQAGDNTRNETK